jgi:hypothetical protein
MDAQELLAQARDVAWSRRVFGEPIAREAATVIPVAAVWCFGLIVRPIGVYRIKDGAVEWKPAVDATGIARGGQIVGIVALLVLRDVLRRWGRRGRTRRGRWGRHR